MFQSAVKLLNSFDMLKILKFDDWVIVGPYPCAGLWGIPNGALTENLYALYHKKHKKDSFCGKNDLVRKNNVSIRCDGCKTKPPQHLIDLTIFLRKTVNFVKNT